MTIKRPSSELYTKNPISQAEKIRQQGELDALTEDETIPLTSPQQDSSGGEGSGGGSTGGGSGGGSGGGGGGY